MEDLLIKSLQPRSYQQAIFETAKNKNTLVILPTGMGKTLIALMLSIERLKKYPGSKALFLAPTKPLAEQHLHTFKSKLPELFADLQLFTGEVNSSKRQKIFQSADIVFSTPQCTMNDLNKALYSLNNTSLVIFDESHRCLKNYAYTKVVDYYKSQALNQRILGLTASPGSDAKKIKEICKHLGIEEVEIRSRDSEDVKPYLQHLEFNKIEVVFPAEFMEIRVLLRKLFDSAIEKLKSRNLLFGQANKITLLELQKRLAFQASQRNFNALAGMSLCAQAIKISHALELLETQTLSGLNLYLQQLLQQAKDKKSRAVQLLVKAPEFNSAILSLQLLLAKNIEHPKIEELKKITKNEFNRNKQSKLIIFTQFRETANRIAEKLKEIPEAKASVFIGQAKKHGVGLSQKEQRAIIEKFKSNELNLIIATSVGEEGLDIPEVSAVIFYEPIPSAIRSIQRRGRTARLAPGKLIILMTKDTRDIAHHYASRAKERKMHAAISQIKEELKENNSKNNPKSTFKTLDDF